MGSLCWILDEHDSTRIAYSVSISDLFCELSFTGSIFASFVWSWKIKSIWDRSTEELCVTLPMTCDLRNFLSKVSTYSPVCNFHTTTPKTIKLRTGFSPRRLGLKAMILRVDLLVNTVALG